MLSKEQQEIQELLAHPGWTGFKALLLVETVGGRPSLRGRLLADLQAAARAGEAIKAARVAGQLDILETILDVPVKFLKG